MNIIDAIKNENIRVSCGDSRLFWYEPASEWVVLKRVYYAKMRNETLYKGDDEQAAIAALIGE